MQNMLWILILMISACGAKPKNDSPAPDPQTSKPVANTFNDKINPIITKSCGGASCHSSGSSNSVFVGNETLFKQKATIIATRITSLDGTKMPPLSSGKILSTSDKDSILNYFRDAGLIPKQSASGSTNTDSNTKPTPSETPSTSTSNMLSYECRTGITIDNTMAKPDFSAKIDPILVKSCAGGGCHNDATSGRKVFVGSATTFKQTDTAILYKLKNGLMPIGGKTIAIADKQLIYQYLCSP